MAKQPKVLIVEDMRVNHSLYQTLFEQAGFTVLILANAEGDFASVVAEFAPDIIAMDLMIGSDTGVVERDGFDAIACLKADARTKDTPIIVLTNFSDEAKVQRAKELGVVDYLVSQGQGVKTLPNRFWNYLQNPRRYEPVHPQFHTSA